MLAQGLKEIAIQIEAAFMSVKKNQGPEGPLAVKDAVIYRSPLNGEIHVGPLLVMSLDATTALISGLFNGHNDPRQLRVARREVVRIQDLRGFLKQAPTTCPCPDCKDPARPAGMTDTAKPPRTDN